MRFVKGDTNEAKFKSINVTLKHMARRLHKAVGVFTPPALISVYVDKPVNGLIHKQLFPLSGVLGNFCCLIEQLPEKVKNAAIEITISYPDSHREKVIFSGKRCIQHAGVTKHIPAGTMISIELENRSIECGGIWVSCTFTVDIHKTKLQTVIIDELEYAYDRLQKNISIDKGSVEQKESPFELKQLNDVTES